MKTNKSANAIKRTIVIIGVIAIAAGVWLWMQRGNHNSDSLVLYGNVDIREVQLAFRQPGRIAQMLFDEGDRVTAGVRMATLDTQPYEETLALAQATVRVAEAELSKLHQGLRPQEITQSHEAVNQALATLKEAERHYNRQYKLLASGASSQQSVDTARATLDQAIASVSATKAALSIATEGFRHEDIAAGEAKLDVAIAAYKQAATALADTDLLAPTHGTVIARVREPGSMVNSQNTVYSLSLDAPVYVRAYIDEPNLGRIAPGTTVQVHSDSSTKTYQGQIGFISPQAEFTPKAVETTDLRTDLVYRLRIIIDEAATELRQGMPVTIVVDTQTMSSKGS